MQAMTKPYANTSPSTTNSNDRDVLSVTQLNRKARQLLETHLSLLWVEGEISNFARPSSGHWYFTLKDQNAQVRCAMFRNRNGLVRFKPEQGQQVVLRARVSLYEGRGDYQLIVEHMEEAGFGVLQRAFEALKGKLSKEGLFDEEYKQPLPDLPRHIGVITSPTGAAIRDVLSVLKRRFPAIPVTVIPVPVQGEGAAQLIANAIALANRADMFDVLLLTRGGGSLEDLWPFNEEIVARAVFDSDIPIVSAVGHEVDVTISDFVADARAATPSAAAELLSPDRLELQRTFVGYNIVLGQAAQRQFARAKDKISSLRKRLRHPGERIQSRAQHLDNLEMRLKKAMLFQQHRAQSRFAALHTRQRHLNPTARVREMQTLLRQLNRRAQRQISHHVESAQHRFAQQAELLHLVSPLNTMQRGYSVLRNQKGSIVKDATTLKPGHRVEAKLAKGEVSMTVDAVKHHYESLTAPFEEKP
ncbi:exodeoxyribonuclease VII large subunit [Aurantivibrio plasticivorans]